MNERKFKNFELRRRKLLKQDAAPAENSAYSTSWVPEISAKYFVSLSLIRTARSSKLKHKVNGITTGFCWRIQTRSEVYSDKNWTQSCKLKPKIKLRLITTKANKQKTVGIYLTQKTESKIKTIFLSSIIVCGYLTKNLCVIFFSQSLNCFNAIRRQLESCIIAYCVYFRSLISLIHKSS